MVATKRKAKRNRHMPVSKAKNAYELLGEIRELILEEPLRYNQYETLFLQEDGLAPMPVFPECGTIGCVAGWVVALKGNPNGLGVWSQAEKILGLKGYQDDELFDSFAAGNSNPQTKAHANRGAAHISRFMQAHKEQLKAKAV